MSAKFRPAFTALGISFGLISLLIIARAAAGEAMPAFYSAPSRAAYALVFLEMSETTTLRVNGDGEERIEFLVTNDDLAPINTAEFYFNVNSTQYWGIEAWDEEGPINYSIVVSNENEEIHVTLYFRESLDQGETYRYFFLINFPNLVDSTVSGWSFGWSTYFPVENFIRTVNLPGGATITDVNPPPDEQTPDFVSWFRAFITEFSLTLEYTLRSLTDQELAEEFKPLFRMHPKDVYVPMPASLALQHAECLRDYILFDLCFPNDDADFLTTEVLSGEWLTRSNSYIDFRGNPALDIGPIVGSDEYYQSEIKVDADAAPTVYARVRPSGLNRTVIQYWLYYYYNGWGRNDDLPGVLGLHEGDWEMVQVVLDGNDQPLYAAYAQHFGLPYTDLKGASKKEWNDLSRDPLDGGDHPIVYPGLDSHASYFGPYQFLMNTDLTAADTRPLIEPAVYLLQEGTTDQWITYKGQWGVPGAPSGGPASPASQGLKWQDPLAWSESALDWDEYAGHHIGKIRAHANVPCNVGVKIEDTGQQFGWIFNEFKSEIAGGEYVVNETNATRSLILHNTYGLFAGSYLLYTTCPNLGTPSAQSLDETPSLTVDFYDPVADERVVARFELPAEWDPEATVATLKFDNTAALALAVDQDNDGDTDLIVPPESVTTEPIIPPGSPLLFVPVVSK